MLQQPCASPSWRRTTLLHADRSRRPFLCSSNHVLPLSCRAQPPCAQDDRELWFHLSILRPTTPFRYSRPFDADGDPELCCHLSTMRLSSSPDGSLRDNFFRRRMTPTALTECKYLLAAVGSLPSEVTDSLDTATSQNVQHHVVPIHRLHGNVRELRPARFIVDP